MDFYRLSQFAETCMNTYTAISNGIGQRQFIEEMNYLQNALATERDINKNLEEELGLYKNLAEHRWALLQEHGYFHDAEGNLLKREDEDDSEHELVDDDLEEDSEEEDEPEDKNEKTAPRESFFRRFFSRS